MTLTPGVYYFSSQAALTGTLTLDTGGDANAIFTILITSSLTTAGGSSVVVKGANTGDNLNVIWKVGSSATLGTDTTFTGTILAMNSVSLGTNAAVEDGRLIALTGAVTLLDNEVSVVPEPATWMLLLGGFSALVFGMKLSRRAIAVNARR